MQKSIFTALLSLLVSVSLSSAQEPKKDEPKKPEPAAYKKEAKPATASPGFEDPSKLTEKAPDQG